MMTNSTSWDMTFQTSIRVCAVGHTFTLKKIYKTFHVSVIFMEVTSYLSS